MTNIEKYEHWLKLAQYDLETANFMLKSKLYVYVSFTCEQAIEKLVKALHILYTGNEAPKSHNILYLFELIFKNDEYYKKITADDFDENVKKYSSLFTRLHSYYIAKRYLDYKRKICFEEDEKYLSNLIKNCHTIIDKSTIEEYLEKDYIEINGMKMDCYTEYLYKKEYTVINKLYATLYLIHFILIS